MLTSDRPPPAAGSGESSRRLRGLLAAQDAIISDLSLPETLSRIVAAACELVGARYGALGVTAADGSPERVVHHGMDDDMVARIAGEVATLPAGHGLFGTVPGGPDVNSPAARTPMTSFVAAPITVRGARFGHLYLTGAQDGSFTPDDEDLIRALAVSAGTAIENARLYEDARCSRDWLNASGEIARALLADADADMLLEVVSRALHVAEADYGALILPAADGRLEATVAVGIGADYYRGYVFDPGRSTIGRAIIEGRSLMTGELSALSTPGYPNSHDYGPMMVTPLIDVRGIRGAVVLIRTAGRVPFTSRDLELATTFADQVALALELNDTRADAEALRALEERHRIAQELHDSVMQRLFATGVGLQRLAQEPLPEETAARLRSYIDDLDETIDEIRDRVFGLRSETPAGVLRRAAHFLRIPASGAADDHRQN